MEIITKEQILEKLENSQLIIKPFKSKNLSEIAYDIELSNEFVLLDVSSSSIIDPQNYKSFKYIRTYEDEIILQPQGFILGRSLEWIEIPNNIFAMVSGKSSLARLGVQVETAYILHPGHRGYVVLEINNRNVAPIKLRAGTRIAQLLFFEMSKSVEPYFKTGTFGVQRDIMIPKEIN